MVKEALELEKVLVNFPCCVLGGSFGCSGSVLSHPEKAQELPSDFCFRVAPTSVLAFRPTPQTRRKQVSKQFHKASLEGRCGGLCVRAVPIIKCTVIPSSIPQCFTTSLSLGTLPSYVAHTSRSRCSILSWTFSCRLYPVVPLLRFIVLPFGLMKMSFMLLTRSCRSVTHCDLLIYQHAHCSERPFNLDLNGVH